MKEYLHLTKFVSITVMLALLCCGESATAQSIAFPPVRERDLVSLSTCDLPTDSEYGLYILDLPDYPDHAIEYRKKKTRDGNWYQVLFLLRKGTSPGGVTRCDEILAVQRVNLQVSKDNMAIDCREKDGRPPAEALVVAIGHNPPRWRDDRFVARKAWAIDVANARFIPLENRILICKPEPPPK
jgi:hypothetical protein